MTYNLLNGAPETLTQVIQVVNQESPDTLVLNEANTFADHDNKILKEFASKCSFPFFSLALSGEYDYHVAMFSKHRLSNVRHVTPLMRACVLANFKTSVGELAIAGLHLTPYTEDLRLPEIDLVAKALEPYEHKIIMGDVNSLSRVDGYNLEMVETFNEMQTKKFTTNGRLRFDAVDRILSKGFVDPAVISGKHKEWTAPTSVNEYFAHSDMRLDYIFLSESLRSNLAEYRVVKNNLTEIASDHYPVVVELRSIHFV